MSSLKAEFRQNLVLAAKILLALCILRGMMIVTGFGGRVPVLDDIIIGVMNFFFDLSGWVASRYHMNL